MHHLFRTQIKQSLHLIRKLNVPDGVVQILLRAFALDDIDRIHFADAVQQGFHHTGILNQQAEFEVLEGTVVGSGIHVGDVDVMLVQNLQYGKNGARPVRDFYRHFDDPGFRDLLVQVADGQQVRFDAEQILRRSLDLQKQHMEVNGLVVAYARKIAAMIRNDSRCAEKSAGFVRHAGYK